MLDGYDMASSGADDCHGKRNTWLAFSAWWMAIELPDEDTRITCSKKKDDADEQRVVALRGHDVFQTEHHHHVDR